MFGLATASDNSSTTTAPHIASFQASSVDRGGILGLWGQGDQLYFNTQTEFGRVVNGASEILLTVPGSPCYGGRSSGGMWGSHPGVFLALEGGLDYNITPCRHNSMFCLMASVSTNSETTMRVKRLSCVVLFALTSGSLSMCGPHPLKGKAAFARCRTTRRDPPSKPLFLPGDAVYRRRAQEQSRGQRCRPGQHGVRAQFPMRRTTGRYLIQVGQSGDRAPAPIATVRAYSSTTCGPMIGGSTHLGDGKEPVLQQWNRLVESVAPTPRSLF